MHPMWATMDKWTQRIAPHASHRMCNGLPRMPPTACVTQNGHKDMWTGDVSLGMFIFGDVYSCSAWTAHTYTLSLHTNDMHLTWTQMCWNCCSVMMLQCQLKFLQIQQGNFQLGNPTPTGHTSKYTFVLCT